MLWLVVRLAWGANVCSRNNPDSARGQKSKCKFDNVYFRVKGAAGWGNKTTKKSLKSSTRVGEAKKLYRFQIEHLRGNKEKIAEARNKWNKKPALWGKALHELKMDWPFTYFYYSDKHFLKASVLFCIFSFESHFQCLNNIVCSQKHHCDPVLFVVTGFLRSWVMLMLNHKQ